MRRRHYGWFECQSWCCGRQANRVVSRRATQVILENSPESKMVEVDGSHLLLQTRAAECAEVVVNFLRALN